MTEIRPFRGWHYTGEVSSVLAPPYDLLTEAGKQALLASDDNNIVAVDLPHMPPVGVGPESLYAAAARKLADLQRSGKLVQEPAAAIYAYSQGFTCGGRDCTRRAMVVGVRATELYDGIWPHEQTFPGPKADRLRLTEATRMQISPIFGVFDDPGDVSRRLWDSVAERDPVAWGRLDGVEERLWPVTDAAVIGSICRALTDAPIFIADGHHRYTTALTYRNTLRDAGAIDENHEANFVLFTLVATDDPGLLVLPTHRMIDGITDGYDCRALMDETAEAVVWRSEPISDALLDDPDGFLGQFGPGAIAFLDTHREAAHIARLATPDTMAALAPDMPRVWRELDVAVLHEFFLNRHILRHVPEATHLGYTASGREVANSLAAGAYQMAALVRATPLDAIRQVALAKSVMPHKSTYFYPKLATGVVLKPLE